MFDENVSLANFIKSINITLNEETKSFEVYISSSYDLLTSILKFHSLKRDFYSKKELCIKPHDHMEGSSIIPTYQGNENKEINDIVNTVCQTLKDKLPHVNFMFLATNLHNLKIKQMHKEKWYERYGERYKGGAYFYWKNLIIFLDNESLSHELIHKACTTSKNGKYYSGFQVIKNYYSFGNGLNEGYTALLDDRYFGVPIDESYITEGKFAGMFECIVGKEKMEKLYFSADLEGLIEELSQYDDRDNIIRLIADLDFIYKKFTIIDYASLSEYYFVLECGKRLINNLIYYYIISLRKRIANNEIITNDNLEEEISNFESNTLRVAIVGIGELFSIKYSFISGDQLKEIITEFVKLKGNDTVVKAKYQSMLANLR